MHDGHPDQTSKPEPSVGVIGLGKYLRGGVVGRFVDAASALVFITAALYFLGYAYYASFTERLHVPFHGIALPVQEYLVSSWYCVLWVLIVVGVGLVVMGFLDAVLDRFALWLKKKRPRGTARSTNSIDIVDDYVNASAAIFVFLLLLLGAAFLTIKQARKEADNVLKQAAPIIVYAPNGEKIPGEFVYLRNYGSTLLVQEMETDGKRSRGKRFFKESSFSGYTILDPKEHVSESIPQPSASVLKSQ
jgi:hypothetical protein